MLITENELRSIIRRKLIELAILNEQDPTRRGVLKGLLGLGAVGLTKAAQANPIVKALFSLKDYINREIDKEGGQEEEKLAQKDALNAVFNEIMKAADDGKKLSTMELQRICQSNLASPISPAMLS